MNEIKIKNAKLNYVDIGSGFPLLFLHAYLLDHKMWLPQMRVINLFEVVYQDFNQAD